MSEPRRLAACLILGGLLASGGARAASPGPQPDLPDAPNSELRVGVAAPRLAAEVPTRLAEPLFERILTGLARGAGEVRPLDVPEACDTRCLADAGREGGVDYVIAFEVLKQGPDFELRMQAISVPRSQVDASVETTCEICGDAEIEARTTDLAASLEARLESADEGEATLHLEGQPAGVEIRVDGVPVGTTPFEGNFEPGPHQIELRLDGFAPQTRKWTGVAGVRDDLDYELAPDQGTRRRLLRKPLGWALVALGAAAVGGGAALVAIDGRPHRGTCQPDIRDGDGDCPFNHATLAAGATTLTLGLVAAGAGAGLLVWQARSDKGRQAQLRMTPTSLQIQGRF